MEYAQDLSHPADQAFLLRRSEDAIFHKLLYLEAINNGFKVAIDTEQNITFNLPNNILEHLQSLVTNLYKKNFASNALQTLNDQEVSIKISDERDYIKQKLSQNIMWLFVTKFIQNNNLIDDAHEEMTFIKLINAPDSNYLENLASTGIRDLLDYPEYSAVIIGDEIKISGNNEMYDLYGTMSGI